MPRFLRSAREKRPRLVVVGAGVGGVEAALGLRAAMGELARIELVSPEREFVYRAMTVAEPFGYARPPRIGFDSLAHTHGIRHVSARASAVDGAARVLELANGERLEFTDLVLALGARSVPWLDGALSFDGAAAVDGMRELLGRIQAGTADEIVFTAPLQSAWTLPLYELALLTSAWCADRALAPPALTVVTPERAPLARFGRAATGLLEELLADRGIAAVTGTSATRFDGRRVTLLDGRRITSDAVVALPLLAGNPVPGVPRDGDGFIPTGADGSVTGLEHVYAIGDATTHPVKQGGLAAQQADTVCAAIAASHGIPVEPAPYEEVMRGMLLTGIASAFLRAGGDTPETASFNALWWPPTKVAGRHLAEFLTSRSGFGPAEPFADRTTAASPTDRAEMHELAVTMAVADAQWGEWESAARWMQTVELIDGTLPDELARMRDNWSARAR